MRDRIRWRLQKALCAVLFYTGIIRLYRCLCPRRNLLIFYFHQMDAERFERCLLYLKQHCHLISLDDYLDTRRTGTALPQNAVALTYDDGYESNYLENYPMLQQYQAPATGFLTAGLIGSNDLFWWDKLLYALSATTTPNVTVASTQWPLTGHLARRRSIGRILLKIKTMPESEKNKTIEDILNQLNVDLTDAPANMRIMNWQQARTMHQAGLSFGAHTLTHPILTRCSAAEATTEITESKTILEQNLQTTIRYFAYPNGEPGDFNSNIKTIVQNAGFDCALTTIEGYNDLTNDLFELKRVPLEPDCTIATLAARTSGLWTRLFRHRRYNTVATS